MAKINIPRPCLDCGKLTDGDTRCRDHQAQLNQKKNTMRDAMRREKKKTLYGGAYQRHAKIVRDNAVTCHLCLDPARVGDPWQADHVEASNPHSELLPAHRSCNTKRGDKTVEQFQKENNIGTSPSRLNRGVG